MPKALSQDHRDLLESVTGEARVLAELACQAALENLAVHEKDYRAHMTMGQRLLRNRLRARGRAIGDMRDKRTGIQSIYHLKELAAYECWHRLLFTRFLTENHLLITDEAHGNVSVTLEECEELAPELGAHDGLDLACRFASRTLPGVFRLDDPVLELPMALNDQVELRKLLASLPSEVFLSDDALGWTYQFWQAKRKREVNRSGKKIDAHGLSPVTQYFTEDYMVEFLLHNTLGAWWVGKIGPIKADTENEARAKAALVTRDNVPAISWAYLRFEQEETTRDWHAAAGTFDKWPKSASLIRLLDPCMGSGHFLVFALPLLVRLRMEEEKLSGQEAVVAVLKDNIYGLELDERCTQIAAFNVALTAWKLAGYQLLPSLHIACSGLTPTATEAEWVALAGTNERARNGMASLYSLFKNAPVLGSLIEPCSFAGDLIDAAFDEITPLLDRALADELDNVTIHEIAVTAQGIAKAAEVLGAKFTLVATNVPYLSNRKQCNELKNFCTTNYGDAKNDLGVTFFLRLVRLCEEGGSLAFVMSQYWLFKSSYSDVRNELLKELEWPILAKLGVGAFETISGEVVNVLAGVWNKTRASTNFNIAGLNVMSFQSPAEKAAALRSEAIFRLNQTEQRRNAKSRVVFGETSEVPALDRFAIAPQGTKTGDDDRWRVFMWEIDLSCSGWVPYQTTVRSHCLYGGRHLYLDWRTGGEGMVRPRINNLAVGKMGVAISQSGDLPATLYSGERFDSNIAPLIPSDPRMVPVLWAYCSSEEYRENVRLIDQSLKVTNIPLIQVPFELAYWQKVADEKYPEGLPKPHSDDPTQWLFNGYPAGSTQPLHVAVARMLGYRWPRQTGSSFPDCPTLGPDGLEPFADEDGIVCLPPVNREGPAASRLRQLLTAALGAFDERALIAAAGLKGSKSKTLEDWLRDEFFEQHVKIFLDRPFIWHVWDGRQDGFHALVNYHALDNATLKKLTYSYLGDWIRQQGEDAKADKPGAAERLGSARSLQTNLGAILKGEAPLDIFVRWKSLEEQALGWQPDLNDGIRQNIRPFLLVGDVAKKAAGVFRTIPLKLKDKDRGIEPSRPKDEYPWFWCEQEPGTDPGGGAEFAGNRWNNCHLTLATKEAARKR